MRLTSFARRIALQLAESFGTVRTQKEAMALLRKSPRNRAEARRVAAGGDARMHEGQRIGRGQRTLEATHRRIVADWNRQVARAAEGRFAW